MLQRICNHAAILILGLFIGAVLTAASLGLRNSVTVEASATHGVDNFAIATGFIDRGHEAIYFLDFITGELRAAVISRRTGQFDAMFAYNVQDDFGTDIKNPRYLMVTGITDLPRGTRNTQLGDSLIYIAEASTGQLYSYALPWDPGASAAARPQAGSFIPMGGGSIRTQFIRDAE